MIKRDKKTDSSALVSGLTPEVRRGSEQMKTRHIREELKKIAADKPEQLAKIIKAWLSEEK